MRKAFRRFKEGGGKADAASNEDAHASPETTPEMAVPALTVPGSPVAPSLSGWRPASRDDSGAPSTKAAGSPFVSTFAASTSIAGSSRLTQSLALYPESPAAPSLYSEGSSMADQSLFSKNTRSTAPSTFQSSMSSGGNSKRAIEERIRVMEARDLSESHDKTAVPIMTSPIEARARDVTSMAIPAMSPVTAPYAESLVGSHGRAEVSQALPTTFEEPSIRETRPAESFDDALATRSANIDSLSGAVDQSSAPRVAGIIAQQLNDFAALPAVANDRPNVTMANSPHLQLILRNVLAISDNMLRIPVVRNAKSHMHRAIYRLGVALGLVDAVVGTVPYPRNWALGTVTTPQDEVVGQLMERLSSASFAAFVEQEGAYVAPVLRGFSPQFAVATVCFGLPRADEAAYEAVASLQSVLPTVHVYGRMDYVRCAGEGSGVVAPFRQLQNPREPPMSISIATERAGTVSGTLGGFLYPLIEEENDDLKGHTFAVTCGHVCLSSNAATSAGDERNALVPSPVLVQIFRKAIMDERNKHEAGSPEHEGYGRALSELDSRPPTRLGPVVWGERTVIGGMMSDLSIIKCDREFKCRNNLGTDLNLSQYDPGLMFSNLSVSEVVSKLSPGQSVFKYGSTSRYTSGNTSASRIVYWSSGKIQSSEFVVTSEQPVFATGGDSGAWILAKAKYGLGVVGMLHSYDGEMKEFGLFTPMSVVLNRLQQVTGVEWGVVGVPHPNDPVNEPVV